MEISRYSPNPFLPSGKRKYQPNSSMRRSLLIFKGGAVFLLTSINLTWPSSKLPSSIVITLSTLGILSSIE